MNISQSKALGSFRSFLDGYGANQFESEEFRPVVSHFDYEENGLGAIYAHAEIERTGLPEGNLLRALDHSYWFAVIGKRGKVTILKGPESLRQFKGRTYLGFHINYA